MAADCFFFWLVGWLAAELKKTGLRFVGFGSGSGSSFPWGLGWVTLLSCGHDDWASLILGFGVVLGWWDLGHG